MLNSLKNQMPSRQLKLANAGDGGLLNSIIIGAAALIGAATLFYITFSMTQDILKDRKMIDNHIVIEAANIEGECSTKKFISSCDVKIVHKGQTFDRSFYFVDFGKDGYTVQAIAQKDDSSNVNVDLALDKMTNRMLTALGLGVLGLLALLVSVGTFRAIPKKQRLKNIMNEPANQPWEFVEISAQVDGKLITYTTDIDGVATEMEVSFEGRKPIILGEDGNKKRLLGIKAKTQETHVLLCKKLKNINFNKAEKKALLGIIKSA